VDFAEADALIQAIRTVGIRHRALAEKRLVPLGLHTGQEVILLELDLSGPRTQAQRAGGGVPAGFSAGSGWSRTRTPPLDRAGRTAMEAGSAS
jgi:hypothetical protein